MRWGYFDFWYLSHDGIRNENKDQSNTKNWIRSRGDGRTGLIYVEEICALADLLALTKTQQGGALDFIKVSRGHVRVLSDIYPTLIICLIPISRLGIFRNAVTPQWLMILVTDFPYTRCWLSFANWPKCLWTLFLPIFCLFVMKKLCRVPICSPSRSLFRRWSSALQYFVVPKKLTSFYNILFVCFLLCKTGPAFSVGLLRRHDRVLYQEFPKCVAGG